MDFTTPRKRLDEPPFGAGQVLEAVGEDRRAVPGTEIGRQPLDRPAPHLAAIANPEPLRAAAIGSARRPVRARDPAGRAALPRSRSEAAARESANPVNRDDGPSASRREVATIRRTRTLRSVSPTTRDGGSVGGENAKSVSKVPTVPARSAPSRPASSRSTRSTSTRFGTMSQGSLSRASTKRSSSNATLPACAGPTTSERPIYAIVVAGLPAAFLRAATSPQSAQSDRRGLLRQSPPARPRC